MYKLTIFIALLLSPLHSKAHCEYDISFLTNPIKKQQSINLSDKTTLHIQQQLSKQTVNNAVIASNVTCQVLEGASFSGDQAEFKKLLNNTVHGLISAEAQDLKVTLVGSDDAVYQGKHPNLEYTLSTTLSGNEQIIYNLTFVNKLKNESLTVSVSGNIINKELLESEFTRILSSLE
ncbi:hypothetical protein KIJ96_06055 [Pseudoalteromonas piscicida]|uniref:hypothetical protein n=1 Tax=Pseudoalteromonas TaxID=53246 RepID=UPI001BA4EFFC|nr:MULTISPECIES: hypothetical protein [Pseudoalteromonas]QUI69717.1 hypothetical protein GSF13_07895 [Pseudoalteromonas sp. M8]UDM62802.1 hypothetical protein KIJ96_06055 [Pseudoalteromonas piscicida]